MKKKNNDKINELLMMAVLSGDMSASDVAALSSLGVFEARPTTNKSIEIRQQQQTVQDALADIDNALALMNSYGDKNDISGPVVNLKKKILGTSSKETQSIDALISKVNQRLRAIAGAAITGTEKNLLQGGIPELKLQEGSLEDTLRTLSEELSRDQIQLLDLPGADPSITGKFYRGDTKPTIPGQTQQPSQPTTFRDPTPEELQSMRPLESASSPYLPDTATPKSGGMDSYMTPSDTSERGGGLVPAIGGITGGLAGSVLGPMGTIGGGMAGTGAGYAIENIIQDLLGKQKQKPIEQVKQAGVETAKSGLTAAATELLLPMIIPKLAIARRGLLASKRPGANISGEKITEDLMKSIDNFGITAGNTKDKLMLNAIDRFSGKNFSLPKILDELKNANEIAFTHGGAAGKPVTAKFNKVLGDALRAQIDAVAPEVGAVNKLYGLGQKAKKSLGGFISRYLPFAAGYGLGNK